MAATSHPLASKIAVSILEDGGNAADAAVAAALVLGIAEPQMTGIGGDCFALIKPAGEERILGLNGSGRAPAGFDAEALRAQGHQTMPLDTPDAVTLPGSVDGFCRLLDDWGSLGRGAVFAPAVRYAETGIPVAPRTAQDWAEDAPRLSGVGRDAFLPGGTPPRPGAMFALPKQAQALQRIAEQGRAGFYEGPVAQDMVDALQRGGGCHTLDDFAAVACEYVTPISGTYRGYELVELPPNGQGAIAILLAGILSHFDLASLDPFGIERTHIETEAAKLAYDARNRFLADTDHMGERLAHLLSPETARALAACIDPARAMPTIPAAAEQVHKETIYLTVVDRDRMAVSLIYSIYQGFGSGIASDAFHILFQNRGAGFSLEPGHPNEAAAGKRPMHTIIPAMLKKDGRVVMPFGVMGGQYQPAGHARVLTNIVDFGMDPQAALDGPRSFPQPEGLALEDGYDPAVRAGLEALGHTVISPPTALGGAQAIWIDPDTDVLAGASDPRKDGCALGF